MSNIIQKVLNNNKPFIYFHTLLFNKNILDLAVKSGKSIEIDISMDKNGNAYIGHPLEFYKFKQIIPPPNNLPIETIVNKAKEAGLFLVLDCKDVRALPLVARIIEQYGVENCLFHSWIKEFRFYPYAPEITIEPHWDYEDLPLNDVLKLKQTTGVPAVSSTRGLTKNRLMNEPDIVDSIISIANGKIDAFNFNLPDYEAPPKHMLDKLLSYDILTWLNIDHVPTNELPIAYLGISDHVSRTTNPKDFY